jgi:hypothetical protein
MVSQAVCANNYKNVGKVTIGKNLSNYFHKFFRSILNLDSDLSFVLTSLQCQKVLKRSRSLGQVFFGCFLETHILDCHGDTREQNNSISHINNNIPIPIFPSHRAGFHHLIHKQNQIVMRFFPERLVRAAPPPPPANCWNLGKWGTQRRQMKGVLFLVGSLGLSCCYKLFCPAFAALHFFPHRTLFQFLWPRCPASWQEAVLGRLSLIVCLWLSWTTWCLSRSEPIQVSSCLSFPKTVS